MIRKYYITLWLLLNAIAWVHCGPTTTSSHDHLDLPEVNGENFYYFGYGSNMLTARIHIQNPTAVKIGAGRLNDYRLDFFGHTELWGGAPATVVPQNGSYVLGTVWNIALHNMADLDDQEIGSNNYYRVLSVPIERDDGPQLMARVYVLTEQPAEQMNLTAATVPADRQPSKTYLQCLVQGAIETGLDGGYVHWLKSVRHNGKVSPQLEQVLELGQVALA